MKVKISVSVEKWAVEWVDQQVKTMRFRSRSHAIDVALVKFIEAEKQRLR